MPLIRRGETELHYELHGDGFPVLLLAPGFMMSSIEKWRRNAARADGVPSQADPTAELAGEFRLIALDQRNAGRSRAPVRRGDGWHSYLADHLAVLDGLGIARCHVIGACIGVSFALALADAAPDRIAAMVLQNPIGASATNGPVLRRLFDLWAASLGGRPDVEPGASEALWTAMFEGTFVFTVGPDAVARMRQPMMLMPGDDEEHPAEVSNALAASAASIEVVAPWKGKALHAPTMERTRSFLRAHTPAADSLS